MIATPRDFKFEISDLRLKGVQNSAYRLALFLPGNYSAPELFFQTRFVNWAGDSRREIYADSSIGNLIFPEGAPEPMVNRKGVFIGAYVPNELKESLRRRAASEHRTLSQEITRILTEAIHGRSLPPGSIDRRTNTSPPRRRDADPLPRRRKDDLPLSGSAGQGQRNEDR